MSEEKQKPTFLSKLWAALKRWGLTGILTTVLGAAGTWLFTTIDNLKDENIAIKQQLIEERKQREAMWMRLYHFSDVQQRTQVQVEVAKQLYNILVYSEKKGPKDLTMIDTEPLTDLRPTTFEEFKQETLRNAPPPQRTQQMAPK
jgi:hypothetical protein